MKRHDSFPILAVVIVAVAPCFSQRASFLALGDFPGGIFESSAQSVSSDGSVVVGYGTTVSGAQARLTIHILLGVRVRTLVNSAQIAGEHSAIWDERDDNENPVNSGIYLYRLETGNQVVQKKMLFVR